MSTHSGKDEDTTKDNTKNKVIGAQDGIARTYINTLNKTYMIWIR